MQNSRQELDKLWGKVTNSISSMQATQTSWKNLRLLIDEVRSNFNTYKASCIEYLDYLMNINSAECKEESKKYENIIDRHKRFVETALSEANEHKRELISEQSMRSGSRVSSTSSVVIRAQARAEAVAAVKKAEMQKKRSALVAQSTIVIEKEKARMEQLYLEEEAAIAIAKANAIDDELGITPDPKELDLPEENSGDKVKFYLEHQCEKTLSNSPRSPSILPHVPTTIQPGLSANETPLQQGPPLHITDPPRHTHVVQQQYDTSFMNSTTPNPLLQDSPLARQYTSQPPVDVTSQPLWLDPRPSRSDQTHFVPPCPIPSNSQTHLVSSHLTAPLMHTSRNSASQPHAYPSTMVKEGAQQNAVTLMPQNPQQLQTTTCHHEQIPHPAEPPISQPLNPNAGTFNLQNQPSQDSSQQRADIGSYVEFMARRELISNKIEKFNDKPESYLVWKESFENMIKGVGITASEKLSLLAEYTTGNAKMLVQKLRNAFITNSEAGVKEVWKKLDERYGSSVVLTKVHLNKLTNFPKIGYKENRKLQEFGDLLLELECAKKDGRLQGLRILDEPIYLQPIITKLPGDIQNRWQKHAFRFKNEYKVDYPPFQEFSKFIQNLALERNDPNLTPEIPERETPPSRRAYKTEIKDGEGGTDMLDLSKWCILHKKPHPLSECRTFRSKPIADRKTFLKQYHICYRCIASTSHLAKDCPCTTKCTECQSNRHLAALHAGKPPDENKPKEEEKDHGGEKDPITAKCTALCGNKRGGRSCAKICLANVYDRNQPEKKIKTYVVVDDQSNCSLAKPELFNQLSIHGVKTSYTLKTCSGTSVLDGKRTKDLVVESLDGQLTHQLANVVECDAIPDSKEEIPTPDITQAYPHLRPIADKIPELSPDTDILLLVGRDAPSLHKVHESRNGTRDSPWAQRLDLGWVILGNVYLNRAKKRISEEKVMGELAAKIQHNTALITKPETEKLMAERDKSIQELICDKIEAKERLIKSRNELISRLQVSKDISGGEDDVDRYRRNLKQKEAILTAREKSLENIQHQMQEQTTSLNELSAEQDSLLSKTESLDRDHREAAAARQEQVKMREENVAAETSQLEISFKESEHMLKEDVEEKANIIQSKDEAIAVLKRTIQDRALGQSNDGKGMSERLKILEKQLEETKENLNRKGEALEKCEHELNEKQNEFRDLQLHSQQELKHLNEKLEQETSITSELKENLNNKDKRLQNLEENIGKLTKQLKNTLKELETAKVKSEESFEKLARHKTEDFPGKVSGLSQTVIKLENILEEREAKVTELKVLTGKLQERVENLVSENQPVLETMEDMKEELNKQLLPARETLKSNSEKHEFKLCEKEQKIKDQESSLMEKNVIKNEIGRKDEEAGKLRNGVYEGPRLIQEDIQGQSCRELAACTEPLIQPAQLVQLQSEFYEAWIEPDNTQSSVHNKVEEIERNLNEVKQHLTQEMNRNMELKKKLKKLQEEKNAADTRCSEMKQALEEFMFSTDQHFAKLSVRWTE